MGRPVDANGRSILHKGHGMTHTCAVPDVCKTPTPGGPVPIPYVNVATDSNITAAAESVKIEGNPVANVAAKIATSSGDEPGSAGGIMSSKFKGTVTWQMGSLDVKAEGKSVVRFLDNAFHNGNSFNSSFVNVGETGLAYADDFDEPCPVCHKPSDEHKILETKDTARICAEIVEELRKEFDAAGDDHAKKLELAKEWEGKWSGYMVGVMSCKCKMTFAAMSGGSPATFKEGFRRIAASKVDVVIGDGGAGGAAKAATKQDYIAANTSGAGLPRQELIAHRERLRREINRRWRQIETTRRKGYSKPGQCAGAHLLARSNHGPLNMTEMFFAPINHWPKNYRFRREGTLLENARFGTDVAVTPETPWGTSVASCHTCQDLLFLTMCPERKCK